MKYNDCHTYFWVSSINRYLLEKLTDIYYLHYITYFLHNLLNTVYGIDHVRNC